MANGKRPAARIVKLPRGHVRVEIDGRSVPGVREYEVVSRPGVAGLQELTLVIDADVDIVSSTDLALKEGGT